MRKLLILSALLTLNLGACAVAQTFDLDKNRLPVVTGKGMQAGMLATLLVGAVRTAATFTRDPAVILSTHSTASSLATAAQDFGQEDDITVLTIARVSFSI